MTTTIELHPEGSGAPIVGEWEGVSATYLIGRSGGMCWSPQIQSGDMPLAVLSLDRAGVSVAPVHPLCHVGTAGQVVTSMTSGDTLQLGVDKYRIHITVPHLKRRRIWMIVLAVTVVGVSLVGGWCLRSVVNAPSVASSSDLYTF